VARKSGALNRIVSKTMAAGTDHVAKVLKGGEALAEAAGAAVQDLLSGSTPKRSLKTATGKAAKNKVATRKKSAAGAGTKRKKVDR
jgi:hypothetical protein